MILNEATTILTPGENDRVQKSIRKKVLQGFLIWISSVSAAALAQSVVPSGTITSYNTGWLEDQVRVTTSVPITNPQNCAATDGYITSPSDPGRRATQTALLAAFIAGRSDALIISGCYLGRPQMIGVTIVP